MKTRKLKYCLLALLLVGLRANGNAQVRQGQQEHQSVYVGLKGGLNLPRMLYWNNTSLRAVAQDTLFKPIGGVFMEFPLGRVVTVAPEAMFVQRGCGMKYQHVSGSEVHYTMDVKYVDLRLPVELRWPVVSYFQPYLTLGAEVGMRLGGNIGMERTPPAAFSQTIEVGEANMGLLTAGAFGGIGFRSVFEVGRRNMMLKLAASFHQGLLDTYSAMEKEGTAQSQNVNAYQIQGWRLPQGLELTFGVALSLDRRDDACTTFSGDRYRRKGKGGRWFGF